MAISKNAQQKISRINKDGTFTNPFIWSDIPDPDVIRVGDAYYMTSTTMHFTPGCPIMKSYDLVNWEIVNYVYDVLEDDDTFSLRNDKSAYGKGSWASSIRYHNGTFYVSFLAFNVNKTYVFQTKDIENGPWKKYTINKTYHDMSMLFDDDGRVYMVYGGGAIRIVELTSDATAVKPGGMDKIIIEKANAGGDGGLPAEGSHMYKLNGMYYIFLIAWPPSGSGRRIEVCYRSKTIDGPYEGRTVLDDNLNYGKAGVAQGGLIETADGKWYAMLFQDHGAVGRIPVLVPVTWENGWPVFGIDGKVPQIMELPAAEVKTKSIITSDDFEDTTLALQWQWNHNPDNKNWSLTERPGYLRITTGTICNEFTRALNTLTQRTFGPECSGTIAIETSGMKNGDTAGFAALQDHYGYAGIKMTDNKKYVVMVCADSGEPKEIEKVELSQDKLYLKINFDFKEKADKAYFYYSTDGENWQKIGSELKMSFRLAHFVGYRFALFNYATQETGGYVDFDYFKISDRICQIIS